MAEVKKIVNAFGTLVGWNATTVNFFGRDLEGITEIQYDDDVPKENMYGAGNMPVGQGEGNYGAKCKLVLFKEEVTAMLDAMPKGKRLQEAAPTDIVVQYVYNSRIYKDIIRNVSITKLGRNVKQGDKVVAQELEVICTHIDWNQ